MGVHSGGGDRGIRYSRLPTIYRIRGQPGPSLETLTQTQRKPVWCHVSSCAECPHTTGEPQRTPLLVPIRSRFPANWVGVGCRCSSSRARHSLSETSLGWWIGPDPLLVEAEMEIFPPAGNASWPLGLVLQRKCVS